MPATRQSGFLAPDDPPSPKYTGETGDKTIRFKLYWRHPGQADKPFVETHEQITTDPEKWSRDIIAWFNSTLRPHETKREFIRCEVIGEVPPAEHKWVKHSAMTKHPENPMFGHCYVASEALYHMLGGKVAGYQAYRGKDDTGDVHWWLEDTLTGHRYDVTADQYLSVGKKPPYAAGRAGPFLTKKPSRRAQIVIDRVHSAS